MRSPTWYFLSTAGLNIAGISDAASSRQNINTNALLVPARHTSHAENKHPLRSTAQVYACKPGKTCSEDILLWGCSKPSNAKILQAFQSKTLRLITNAPWYVNNQTLRTDLSIPYINEVIKNTARKNFNHHNPLIANLYNRPLKRRRLLRCWPDDLIEWPLEPHQWMEPYSRHMPDSPQHLLNTL